MSGLNYDRISIDTITQHLVIMVNAEGTSYRIHVWVNGDGDFLRGKTHTLIIYMDIDNTQLFIVQGITEASVIVY